jgi:hypothetical protein
VRVLAAALLFAGAAHGADCPVPGEKIHWIADYCMARLGTDDEIPAMDCIMEENKKVHADACAAKRHYKRELCRLVDKEKLERCLADPDFMGRTVRNGGVGG